MEEIEKNIKEDKKIIGKPFVKGNIPWNKGIPRTQEEKRKIRDAVKGRKHTEEEKRKLSIIFKGRLPWNTGKTLSEEHKKKVSDSLKGEKNPFYGKKHTEESKKKMKEHLKGRVSSRRGKHHTEESKRKMSEAQKGEKSFFYGQHHTEETKRKISNINKKLWQDKEFATRMIKSFKVNPTKLELKAYDILQEILPDQYILNSKTVDFIIGRKIPDFVNTNGKKKIIEANGGHWHKDLDKEKKRLKLFKSFGYDTLIIWDYELKDIVALKQKILNFNESDHLTIEEEIKLGRLAVSKA